MSRESGRSLTRSEFDAVIRRAAELAVSEPDGGDRPLSEAELFRIAQEVGLSHDHVRRALVEVRSQVESGGIVDRVFGPAVLTASRVVGGTPEELGGVLDRFLVESQLLQKVRHRPESLHYRPAVDWISKVARAASLSSRKHYIASARSVEVFLDQLEEGKTLVTLRVDPGTRSENIAGAAMGGGSGGLGIGIGAAASVFSVAPVEVAVTVGILTGVGILSGVTAWVGSRHRKKLEEVRAELEGVLDSLETGASLDPPPPSWRQWVKRQFHGVARDVIPPR
ncbi:MAG: hypothetical protein OEZ65_06955 [Gemmatimonadota bacterium]|nr:hypothetical protein [Gemmatimonadota bacterium]